MKKLLFASPSIDDQSVLQCVVILVAEDSPDDEALVLRGIGKTGLGAEVWIARDGAEAVEFLRDGSKPLPNLVILDYKMPKLDGLEVLRIIRANARTTALTVVCMSASDDEAMMRELMASGASAFVQKPLMAGEYTEAVRKLTSVAADLTPLSPKSETISAYPPQPGPFTQSGFEFEVL